MGDVKTPDRGVVKLDLELSGNEPAWLLLRSDAHHDAVGSHRELEEKHLREAKRPGLHPGHPFNSAKAPDNRRRL